MLVLLAFAVSVGNSYIERKVSALKQKQKHVTESNGEIHIETKDMYRRNDKAYNKENT